VRELREAVVLALQQVFTLTTKRCCDKLEMSVKQNEYIIKCLQHQRNHVSCMLHGVGVKGARSFFKGLVAEVMSESEDQAAKRDCAYAAAPATGSTAHTGCCAVTLTQQPKRTHPQQKQRYPSQKPPSSGWKGQVVSGQRQRPDVAVVGAVTVTDAVAVDVAVAARRKFDSGSGAENNGDKHQHRQKQRRFGLTGRAASTSPAWQGIYRTSGQTQGKGLKLAKDQTRTRHRLGGHGTRLTAAAAATSAKCLN
jgi:hypothetical protein